MKRKDTGGEDLMRVQCRRESIPSDLYDLIEICLGKKEKLLRIIGCT